VADVFISYAEGDRARAEQLADALTDSGLFVWWDRQTLRGPGFAEKIEQELQTARCVVVLWSRTAIATQWVQIEARRPAERGVLLPILIDDVRPPIEFRQIATRSLIGWNGDTAAAEFRRVLRDVTNLVSPSAHIRRGSADAVRPAELNDADTPPNQSNAAARSANRTGLFLCYRREDAQDATGRLHDRLVDSYGSERVFMDIDSVPLGIDFVDHVSKQISLCSVIIVMIGKQWLKVKDKRRRRRLDNDDDLVRAEIAAARQQDVPVIPVLIQDLQIPHADDLPENIRLLARRNGLSLSATRWRTDVERLIKELDRVMKS
jgi:hypothetical protein